MNEEEDDCTQNFDGKAIREHQKDIAVGERIILKRILDQRVG
jgi:hypothetical protein